MASNAKNLAELLNNESTIAVADVADGSITTAKLASGAVTTVKIADDAVTSAKALNSGRRNIIINGAMNVAQRGTSFTAVTNGKYTLDRFNYRQNVGGVTVTQDSSAPDGFSNSLKVDVTTAASSLSSGQWNMLEYNIEAQDLQRLAFGTSSAKNFTLSFYVKSNKTGTYAVNITQQDNSAKQATLNYTINSANTWERKSLTFTGDTSGVINDDNGVGFLLYWWLAVGTLYTSGGSTSASFQTFADANHAAGHAVNILDNAANEWFITGVQLEVGSNASDFEHRSFAEELTHCQRYCETIPAGHQMVGRIEASSNNWGKGQFTFKTAKRSGASLTVSHTDTSSPLMNVDWTSTNFTSAFSNLTKSAESTSGITFRLTDSSFSTSDGGAAHISPNGGDLIIEDEL